MQEKWKRNLQSKRRQQMPASLYDSTLHQYVIPWIIGLGNRPMHSLHNRLSESPKEEMQDEDRGNDCNGCREILQNHIHRSSLPLVCESTPQSQGLRCKSIFWNPSHESQNSLRCRPASPSPTDRRREGRRKRGVTLHRSKEHKASSPDGHADHTCSVSPPSAQTPS